MKFEKENNIIYMGDSINILENDIEDNSIDLIFVDPPYNIGKRFASNVDRWKNTEEYLKWSYRWIDLCVNKLKDSGSMYIMSSTQFMPYFDIYISKKMSVLSRIVWCYDSSGVQAKNFFGSMYEPILHCVKDANNYTFNSHEILVDAKTGSKRKLIDYRKAVPSQYNTEKVPGNVWNFNRVRYRMEEYENHPTQKPILLLERIIKASSNIGDIVLDPFSGTFTTSYVANNLRRKSIGIEVEEEYVKIGLRRLRICEDFNGEKLKKPLKSYEENYKDATDQLTIFQ